MSSGPVNVGRDEVERMMAVAAHVGPFVLPMLDALRQGLIGVTFLLRDQRAPLGDMRRSPLPMLAVIGDDDEASCGPAGWRPALPAIHWARAAMVHAAAGKREHYAGAVAGTLAGGRFLLVETSSRHADAWTELLHPTPTLIILPRGGFLPLPNKAPRH